MLLNLLETFMKNYCSLLSIMGFSYLKSGSSCSYCSSSSIVCFTADSSYCWRMLMSPLYAYAIFTFYIALFLSNYYYEIVWIKALSTLVIKHYNIILETCSQLFKLVMVKNSIIIFSLPVSTYFDLKFLIFDIGIIKLNIYIIFY